jgi:hypothetical protein
MRKRREWKGVGSGVGREGFMGILSLFRSMFNPFCGEESNVSPLPFIESFGFFSVSPDHTGL